LIAARGLTKDYGDKRAVDGMTFTVQPGVVTGFLGPNGSGKSTTMRLILGLDAPTAGDVTVNGKHYRDHTPVRCTRSGRCWRRAPSTPGVRRSTTCSRSRRPMESPAGASRS
jgi:ABC-type branched-subunit amino acid transport system ATPase component